jgi:hypothetical protein
MAEPYGGIVLYELAKCLLQIAPQQGIVISLKEGFLVQLIYPKSSYMKALTNLRQIRLRLLS